MSTGGIDFTRAELGSMRRASHNLQRVAAIMVRKFGEDDGTAMVARGLEALIMELFNDNTTEKEKADIEATLRAEFTFALIGSD